MKAILIWSGAVVGAIVVLLVAATAVGAMLPVAHVASRTETFAVPPAKLWDRAVAQFHRTNDGTYAIIEQSPPHRFVTAIIAKGLPFGGRWTFDFQPAGAGTTLTITEHGEVYNPFFRFVSRFVIGHTKSLDDFMAALRKEKT